jgi:very-short-patch-repair endonuclease
LKLKRNPLFLYKNSAFSSINIPMYNQNSKNKAKESLRKLYLNHPEKLLNARLKRNNMTLIEKKIANLLDELRIKYEWNKYIRTKNTWRFPDFKIGNLVIECDGIYWHKNTQEKDKQREQELEDIGLEVIRFDDKQILNNLEDVKKCIMQKLNL